MRKIFSLLVAALMCAGAMAATYTVAGSQEVLGSNWSTTDTDNDMTLVDDVYQLVKENLTLGASTYEYKVVQDHAWANAWPSSNAKLTIAEDGVYDVTFTFNESTKAVNAVAEKKGSAVVEKHYLVVGEESVVNGAGWNNDNAANLMTSTDEGLTYKLTIENLTLQAKNYEYKIVEKGTWTAYYGDGKGGNAKFEISETAVYTIEYVFTVATSTCVVTATKTSGAEPIETNYYLVGSKHGWEPTDANKLTATATEGEFSITTTLAVGDQIKVLGVQGAVQTWYPDGMGTDYTVDAAHAGEKTIYFRPAGNEEWETFHEGGFFIIENPEPSVVISDHMVYYLDKNNQELSNEVVTLHVPIAPIITGFTFVGWQATGMLADGITLQAVYQANIPTSAPAVYTNPANPAQKLIKNGNVYILTDDKTYTITGLQVK